jgi:hypothetical protein
VRYETDVLGATQMSRSLVFSKEEFGEGWNISTYVDRRELEDQLKEERTQVLSKTRGRATQLAPQRPTLVGRFDSSLQRAREEKALKRQQEAERREIFGGADASGGGASSSSLSDRYPEGYRANVRARGTRSDRLAVLELDTWEPPALQNRGSDADGAGGMMGG